MNDMHLRAAIDRFAARSYDIPDIDLERAWEWGEYDEGVRFAFFRTYEELRDLAAGITALRRLEGIPPTLAQTILAQYHAAFLDLRAVTLGIDDISAQKAPAEGEWPMRRVLLHMVRTERSFYTVCRYAVERVRSRDDRPLKISDDAWDAFWSGDPFDRLSETGAFSEIMAYVEQLHERILDTFGDLDDEELHAPSVFWESRPMSVRFRLHRFDSHLRQHTIQLEKARQSLALPHPEALRLWRLIYAALAEVEGASLGAGGIGYEDGRRLAEEIEARSDEIAAILDGEYHARPTD
jgi:hypothetical protein